MAASIEEWLKEIGLAQYAELFVQNAVDRATLEILTDDDLKELGLPFGPRKRVRAALAAGRQPAMAVSPSRLGPAPDGERRQLTVLFCDMVGSTEIARRVEPETLQIIVRLYEDCCEACIGHFDGYVYQHLGDGIVAFFGYPLAHEGEAARAIRAALEIQQAIARLGAQFEGVLRRYQRRGDGTVRDTVMFSITSEEWPAVRAGLETRVG